MPLSSIDQARVRCGHGDAPRQSRRRAIFSASVRDGIGECGVLHHLEPRHPMHEIGEIGEDGDGIAAASILFADLPECAGRIARHHRLEQVDDAGCGP